jgi:hypothetical protein
MLKSSKRFREKAMKDDGHEILWEGVNEGESKGHEHPAIVQKDGVVFFATISFGAVSEKVEAKPDDLIALGAFAPVLGVAMKVWGELQGLVTKYSLEVLDESWRGLDNKDRVILAARKTGGNCILYASKRVKFGNDNDDSPGWLDLNVARLPRVISLLIDFQKIVEVQERLDELVDEYGKLVVENQMDEIMAANEEAEK